jgi:HEAT repeat protein
MRLGNTCILIAMIASCALPSAPAGAQGAPETREYSRKGELSPGTQAPSIAGMVATIERGSPIALKAALEYGERVACAACVPLLEAKLLASDDASVREMSAWWLRHQPFAGPAILKNLKLIATTDPSAQRRARASEALGEFMDPFGLPALTQAAKDVDPTVRAAAVRGLGRLNNEGAGPVIAAALSDPEAVVRGAALDVLLLVASLRDFSALLPVLADPDAALRAHAARLCGELRLSAAEAPLSAMLSGDAAASARKAAAWALGRIGGATGRSALAQQKARETDPFVQSAIGIAERMQPRTP